MRRKRHGPRVDSERWLVSYADFVTLLFAFFVVLYASSRVDSGKMGALGEAIGQAFQQLGVIQQHETDENARLTAAAGRSEADDANLAALQARLESTLEKEIRGRSVALRLKPEGLVISLREMGFFDSGSASLRGDAEPTFQRIANLLHECQSNFRIEGHTDNVPIHTQHFHSNWELSTARATEMVRQLITRYDVSPERLSAAGYAEFHPIATNSTDEGRGLNRRIDIIVLRSSPIQPKAPTAKQTATLLP